MAVKLRLRRIGRKKQAIYRIVAADARSPRDGRFIEEIGFYNPLTNPASVEVKEDRALYWLQNGALPTDTVKNIFRQKGIILRFDLMRRGLSEEQMAEELKKWEVLQIERAKKMEVLAKQAEKEAKKRVKAAAPAEQEAAGEPAEAPAEATAEAPAPEKPAETAAPESSEEKAETTAPETEVPEKKSEEKAEASAQDESSEAKAAPEKTEDAAEAEKSE